jgi:hypothetical protein
MHSQYLFTLPSIFNAYFCHFVVHVRSISLLPFSPILSKPSCLYLTQLAFDLHCSKSYKVSSRIDLQAPSLNVTTYITV